MGSILAFIASLFIMEIKRVSSENFQQFERLSQNEFNHNEAILAREYYSEPERFNRMTSDLGWNPNLAAAAIAGNASGVTQPAQAAAPTPQVLGDSAFSNLFGGMMDRLYDTNEQSARVRELDSRSRFNDIQSFYFPLSFEETKRLNDEQINLWKSHGDYYDAFADYYNEMANWVGPLSAAECADRWANFNESMAQIELIGEKILTEQATQDLISAQVGTEYSKQALNYANAELAQSETLLTEQKRLTEVEITNLRSSEAGKALCEKIMASMDVTLRQSLGGLSLPKDVEEYIVLAGAVGDSLSKHKAEKLVEYQLGLSRRVYDQEVKNQLGNYWNNMLISLGDIPGDIAGGFGAGFGAAAGARVFGSVPIGAGRGAKAARGARGARGARSFTSETRVGSDGRTYRSFQGVNGDVMWSPID